ncbi:MAG: division/cell wall cluster transcriptional repressor MraZ [Bacteroidetes bacterium]|nr:division/cell wall cluster transcriptional repressor MraZ [Bacteroidota bacterium]
MSGYIGEFPSTVDSKGRFLLPAGLKKQIHAKEQSFFVVHRGMEKHLVVYTKKEWDKIGEGVNNLNLFVEENREFIRKFHRGATVMEPDNTNRLLLPQQLLDYAGISKDIVLYAYANRIEIWSQKEFDKLFKDDKTNYSKLAERVMGKKKEKDDVS